MCAHMCVAGSERKSARAEDLTGAAKRDGPLVPRTAEAARGPLDVASSAAGAALGQNVAHGGAVFMYNFM